MNNEKTAIHTTYFSIIGNVGLALIKGLSGFFGNSYALIADAIESTTDIFSSVLVLFGLKYAKRPADENHPYGHGKIEPLITFLVVAFLVTSATIIAYESIQNIQTPHKAPKAWTLIVLGGIILWKEISFRIIINKSKETNSSSLKADAWHHRSDAITSIMAFIGISIALIFGKGFETADDWAALLASVFILYNSYLIFRPALGEIMDEHLYDDLLEEIRKESVKVKGVLETEKCFIRKAGMKYHVDLHAIVDSDIPVEKGHHISHKLKDHLKNEIPNLGYILIHIEPNKKTTSFNTMTKMKLETKRLLIRPINLNDKKAIFEYRHDKEVNKYQGWIPETIDEVEKFIKKLPEQINEPKTWFQFVIIEKVTEKIVGDIGIHFMDNENKQAEIGCTLNKDFQNKGYATESVTKVIDYLFKELNKHRIITSIDPNNTNSIRLIERIGFRKEAHFVESILVNGKWVDDLVYALTEKDWEKIDKPLHHN